MKNWSTTSLKIIGIPGKDGGYMIAPAHILQNDVSPEHALKFIELYKKQESSE